MRRGFTLIELLVAIGIIAILIAILWPVFAKAGQKARQSSCLSNMKQVVLAQLMYANDFDDKLQPCHRLRNPQDRSVFDDLYPYVRNSELFWCPEDNKKSQVRPPLKIGENIRPSYGMRAESSGLPLANIGNTRTYPLTLDLGGKLEIWSTEVEPKPKGRVQPLFDKDAQVIGLPIQHNLGVNIAFADGHCKWWEAGRLYCDFQDTSQLGSGQIKTTPPRKAESTTVSALVEDDAAIITLSAPLPVGKRFILVYDGVVQYSDTNK